MDDFLTKPVDVEALRSTLQRWVDNPSAHQSDARPDEVAVLIEVPAVDPDVLDPARLDELLDLDPGDPSMVLRFIGRFGANARTTVSGMREAKEAGAAYELGRLAHALKGSAANLGAHRLAALCKEVEFLGDDGVLAQDAELERVAQEVDAAASALEEFAAGLSVGAGDQRG
jgi:HPt (histidine-containing phosphotransfer) domain-containing protein